MDTKQLNKEGRELWDRKAQFWDELHGDKGNLFHRQLVEPAELKLLQVKRGERVLDVGCGNGALTRRIASAGAHVTGIDFSAEMIRLAKARGHGPAGELDYLIVAATDKGALMRLGVARFDSHRLLDDLNGHPDDRFSYLINSHPRKWNVFVILCERGRFVRCRRAAF